LRLAYHDRFIAIPQASLLRWMPLVELPI